MRQSYKFRTKDKQAFLADLAKLGLDTSVVSQESIDAGYYQDDRFAVKWLGKLTIGQEWDEEGNILNAGEEIEGEFVDMISTTILLPDKFYLVFADTVLDDRYPHLFS
jgi:hypothetical protein